MDRRRPGIHAQRLGSLLQTAPHRPGFTTDMKRLPKSRRSLALRKSKSKGREENPAVEYRNENDILSPHSACDTILHGAANLCKLQVGLLLTRQLKSLLP